ncbi:MAG: ABC transporter permease [SAR324 cluster bacterium]|nr:ABC transporter permease [SAR324 cluster bacterium]MBL7034816.1 ABC transporter permease [SAR324 cluster bacterium]
MRIFLEKRVNTSSWGRVLVLGSALLLVLIISWFFFLVVGIDPQSAYKIVGEEIFLTKYGWQDLLVKMTPLLFTGLAVALAAQMRQWNIGAEGQFHMGTFAMTWVVLHFDGQLPGGVLIVFMIIMAMIGGGLWGSIPGYLKANFGVNEIITSLLLNYVAAAWIDHLLFGAWRDPDSNNFPITKEFSEAAQLPAFGNTSIHAGLIIAFILIAVVAWILMKTKLGFQIRLTGDNPDAARYSGVSIKTLTILVFAASGAIAGLAGFSEVSGIHYRLQQNISIGYGYTGIIVAWLARNHPLGVVLSAFFMSIVFVSAEVLQIEYGLPISMVYLYQGIILFTVLGSEIFTEYKLRITRLLV